jgi:hypothetical protein
LDCANRDCGWSAVIVTLSDQEARKPDVCLQQPVAEISFAPLFFYLDFLRGEQLLESCDRRDMD